MQDDGPDGGGGGDENLVRFTMELESLRSNSSRTFNFHGARLGRLFTHAGRWTSLHARQVMDALLVNTSIVILNIDLHICTVPAINLFFPFIRSTPRLEHVSVDYDRNVFNDSKAVQDQYESQISNVLRAVLQSTSIKSLVVRGSFGNSPDAMYDLLAQTRTLTSFASFATFTTEMAFAVAGGLARNSSLETVDLSAMEGPLDIALAGIGSAPKIQSLEVFQKDGHTKELYLSISKVLHVNPSLKTLVVGDIEFERDDDTPIDPIILDLQRPACAGLETLKLNAVIIGATPTNLSDIGRIEKANHSIQTLDLSTTHFSNRGSVRLLYNLVGLRKLIVRNPVYDEADDEEPDCWAELIRRQRNALEVHVVLEGACTWDIHGKGIVNGAIGHESLKTLHIEWDDNVDDTEESDVDEQIGDQLRQVLANNKSLDKIFLENANITPEGAVQLADGIAENKSLQNLVFHSCSIPYHCLTTALEWLLTNQTLKTFDLYSSNIEGGDDHSICRLLARVFLHNKSLANVTFPRLIIKAEDMLVLIKALAKNKTINLINFSLCNLDEGAWNCLERALLRDDPNQLSITSIDLPLVPHGSGILNSFLRNLPHMSCIKNLHVPYLPTEDDNLLLHAVKEKKTLLAFTTGRHARIVKSPIEKEIDFYFKLNRFGRQILDYTNVRSSLWSILLARMTSDPKDVDALFFFLREYFSNYRGGGSQQPQSPPSRPSAQRQRQQQQQQQQDEDQSSRLRPCKLARLE